jgi:hypothetical protein
VLSDQSESVVHLFPVSFWLNLLLSLIPISGGSSSRSYRSAARDATPWWQQEVSNNGYIIK